MVAKAKPTLLELAKQINDLTAKLVSDLEANGTPEPTFAITSEPIPENSLFNVLRSSINDAANDLLRLVNGPKNEARTLICTLYDLAAWQVACEFKFFEAVPEDGSANVNEIAEKVGMDADRVARFLRILATERVFEEVEMNAFRHTSKSVLYLRDPHIRDAVHYQLDEFFMASSETATSIRASPRTTSRSNNPFVSRHGVELFQFYQNDRKRAGRFASAMTGIGKMERQFEDLRDSYAWDKVEGGKVIDVGGGNGHMSLSLARTFPNLELVVEDSLAMLSQASQQDLSDLNGRVTFLQHNFFEPQPIIGAKAYLLRYVTHNWSDEDCVRIFKAMVPALEKSAPGTPFLINDIVLPSAGDISPHQEHRLRQVDIMMMVVLGGKQRAIEDFQKLLEAADARYRVKHIHGAGDMSLIEAVLDL